MTRLTGSLLPIGALALVAVVAAALLRLPWLDDAIDALFDAAVFAGAARVIDGDTLDIDGRRVRLSGVDAPELAQTCIGADGEERSCGREVRAALAAFIGADVVACRDLGRDRYQRILAVCAARGQDLAAWLVTNGLAAAYAGNSGNALRGIEEAARSAGRGLWAGEFQRPELWRRRTGD